MYDGLCQFSSICFLNPVPVPDCLNREDPRTYEVPSQVNLKKGRKINGFFQGRGNSADGVSPKVATGALYNRKT